MKASENQFLKFLQRTNQFVIPIYQRKYSWTLDECAQLWSDIVRTAKDPSEGAAHFVGSIVYIENDLYQVGVVPKLLVIDGQQRLTTLSLLISALARSIEQAGAATEITHKKLANYYLFNSEELGDDRYKLLLTRADRTTLKALVDQLPLPDEASNRLVRNHEFFMSRLGDTGVEADAIFHGLTKLMIVDISLDRTHDNPQLIFESLNSTGLELTQADLIRNFVLMGLEPEMQEHLYNTYWFPMEGRFGADGYAQLFDRFMRDYLTLKTGRIPNIDQIYAAFKEYSHSLGGPIEALVAEIARYSKFFVAMAIELEPSKKIRAAVHDINTLRVDVAYPFLLHVYDLCDRELISPDDLHRILRLIESYVFRRVVCGIPTNTLNKTFAALPAQLAPTNPLDSLEAAFLLKDSYRRFPDDHEFRQEFVSKDVYNLRSRNYLLRKLENDNRKEAVDVETFTIEHVLPQNPELSDQWQTDLGEDWQEVQGRYLHTIGNLTLTGYNSELSDRPFTEKRDMEGGFKDSPIRLNRGLAKLDAWNEEEIRRRASGLASSAVKIWSAPSLAPQVLDMYRPTTATSSTYTLDDHPYLAGPVLQLFQELRKRVLNIDSSVTEEVLKLYIAYKTLSNFLDVVPQKTGLKLSLDITIEGLKDPEGWARDVSGVGRWGNGDVEVTISGAHQLDYGMFLIEQAYVLQSEVSEA